MFVTVTESAEEGEIHWEGSIEGDWITGSFYWEKAGQEPLEYRFESRTDEDAE